jgi:hypothetical protein
MERSSCIEGERTDGSIDGVGWVVVG